MSKPAGLVLSIMSRTDCLSKRVCCLILFEISVLLNPKTTEGGGDSRGKGTREYNIHLFAGGREREIGRMRFD